MKTNLKKSGKSAPEKTNGKPIRYMPQTNEEYNKNLKERLEAEWNATIINHEKLKQIAPEFAAWLSEIVRYGNIDSQVLMTLELDADSKNIFKCHLYTNDHTYSICGYEPSEANKKGYLGCTCSTRKNRPGENWNRGNDLPDGKYSRKTFDNIVKAIVAFELKSLQLWRK